MMKEHVLRLAITLTHNAIVLKVGTAAAAAAAVEDSYVSVSRVATPPHLRCALLLTAANTSLAHTLCKVLLPQLQDPEHTQT
jgi:hypothetical protein